MRNKFLLSVAASALLTTSAFAGTITPPATLGVLGEEAISMGDVTVTASLVATSITNTGTATQAHISYTPTDIPAGTLSNPVFKYTFSNVKDIDLAAAIATKELNVFEVVDPTDLTTWKKVGANPVVSGADLNVLTFSAIDGAATATNNKQYVIAEAVASYANTPATLLNANGAITVPMGFNVAQGSTGSVGLTAELYSGDSQALTDTTTSTSIMNISKEYSGEITTKLDAVIDSANNFLTFNPVAAGLDILSFDTTKKAVLAGSELAVTSTFADFELVYDNNLTTNALLIPAATTVNDFNATGVTADITAAVGGTVTTPVTLDVSGNTAILPATAFSLSTSITSGTTVFPLIESVAKNAGEWTVDGYAAQIPNAAGLTTHDTVLKFTNRAAIDADIFFTIIDPDGTVATLSSVANPEITNIVSNATGQYKVSELLALITDPAFNKTSSVSIEVLIPATATKVYGMASFKNVALGQFKDLPVYSNGNSY